MNTQDELERMLTSELHDRADGLGGAGFGFADVKGRATKIRRNRRIAAGAGVAAALAIVVPTAMSAGGTLNGDGRNIDPATTSPTPVEVHRTTLTLDGLTRGEAPTIEYSTPGGIVFPDGSVVDVPSYQAILESPTDGGWVVVDPAADGISYLDADFHVITGTATTGTFKATPDRSRYAFVAVEAGAESLVVRSTTDSEDGMVWDLPPAQYTDVVGFVADNRVVVSAHRADGTTDMLLAEPDGTVTDLPDYVKAVAADPSSGLISAQTQANEDGSGCFGVIDPDDAKKPLWETCNNSLGSFSPDGRFVMASGPYLSGEGPVSLDVLDSRTGATVAEFRPEGQTQITLITPAWESGTTIVAPAYEGEVSTMLRFGVDGTLEEVVDRSTEYVGDRMFWIGRDRAGM